MMATYDVVIFSYLDRPILDVYVGKTDVGLAGEYPNSGRGTMAGLQFPIGPQTVSWRLDGPAGAPQLGDKIIAKNKPEIKGSRRNTRFLAVHIYPDATVEFIVTEHFPGLSPRGEEFHLEWESNNGR